MSNTLLMLAILPGILIIIYVYKKDKVEKEPWSLIFRLMIFGALSCIPASIMEMAVDSAMPAYQHGTLAYAAAMAFCSAAFCEELCKFFFLRLGTWKHPDFGYRFDGIVYGVAVAVGFAVLENILYVSQYGFETAIVRAFMSVPLHAFCGVFMGIFYGAAKQAQIQGRSSGKFIVLALIVPMLIHGFYDTLAFLESSTASAILLGFVVLMYFVSIHFVRQFSRDDWKSGFYPETRPLSDGAGYAGPQQTQNTQDNSGRRPYSGRQGQPRAGYRAYPGQVQDGKIILLCPHCRRGLRVPVGLGQVRVRCPHCGHEFSQMT